MNNSKDAFFEAKDLVKQHIDTRIDKLESFVAEMEEALRGRRANPIASFALDRARGQIEVLNEVHNYIRNSVLFDTEKYK